MKHIIPKYLDKDFYIQRVDLGQNSFMSIAKNTNANEYKEYLNVLASYGFDFYTDNIIGDNLFATYINNEYIVTAMYLKAFEEVRVTVDDRDIFSLPGLKGENIYEDLGDTSITLLSDSSVIWPGRMGYAYKLADGSFFLIDGGYWWCDWNKHSSAEYIMGVLDKFADDPQNIKIAAWLMTHIHEDHFGGFMDMAKDENIRSRVTIEKLIYNESCDLELLAHTKGDTSQLDRAKSFDRAIQLWNPKELIKAHPGQEFFIRNLTMTVYSTQDLVLCAKNTATEKYITTVPEQNDTSVVTKIDFMGKTTLYLGDSSFCAHRDVLAPLYNSALKADILQVAHHGYGNTGGNFIYEFIDPSMVFWPVCRNHFWGQDVGYKERGLVYIGVKDVKFNKILFKEGIKHFIHEEECITISDFDTWEGIRWKAVKE